MASSSSEDKSSSSVHEELEWICNGRGRQGGGTGCGGGADIRGGEMGADVCRRNKRRGCV